MKASEVVDYYLNWIEWVDDSSVGTNGKLLASETGSDVYIGDYATTDGVFLNPATTIASKTGILPNSLPWATGGDTGDAFLAGDIGTLKYFPNVDGTFKETKELTIASGVVRTVLLGKQAEIASYNGTVDTYNGKKNAYNTAVEEETARRSDLFKAMFEAPIEIPERPCPPTALPAFTVWTNDLTTFAPGTSPTTSWTHANAGNKFKVETYNGFRHGFIQAASDKTDKTKLNADAAKVFGVFGQGTHNVPDTAKPFRYVDPANTDSSGMMISIYPSLDNSAGLTAVKKFVHIEAKALDWDTFGAVLPSVAAPAAPAAPNAGLGATALTAGMLGLASVYSLYV